MKKALVFVIFIIYSMAAGLENFVSMVLRDSNGDGLYDASRYCFSLQPEDLVQLAVASEVAYKLGLYSGEYVDFNQCQDKARIILRRNRELPRGVGAVRLEGRNILIEGNDNQGLLAAREFFWRWPYLWKVEGAGSLTWTRAIKRMEGELRKEGIGVKLSLKWVKIIGQVSPTFSTYQKRGEVLEAAFQVRGNFRKLEKYLRELSRDRRRGENPHALNFPYIRKLTFISGKNRVSLERWGSPEEFLKPSYGVFPGKKRRKTPELERLFSSPLALILERKAGRGAIDFAFRAGLSTTEAHFPFVYLSEKNLPPERTAVVLGMGRLTEIHRAVEETHGLCLERGKTFWFLRPECAENFSSSFLFPALRKEKNLYFSRFFLEKMRFALPPAAQRAMLGEHIGRPYISGETYGKVLVYSREIEEKDEGERLKEILKGKNYTRALAYLSESPERRRSLEREFGGRVKIRSAYKAGLFWILEEVLPKIKGADRIVIHVKRVKPGRGGEITSSPNQFLYELYPVDEILSKRLGIPLERIEFVLEDSGPLYAVEAFTRGKSMGRFELDPPVMRDPFPRVEGWVTAWRGKSTVLSRRIKTDPELAWEFYRQKFLPWLWNFIMKRTRGNPTWDKQPFFSYIEMDFQAPEPDMKLGLGQELVSTTEALHDELYFFTLYFVSKMLKPTEEGGKLKEHIFPGAILPYAKTSPRGMKFSIKVYDYRKPGVYLRERQLSRFYPLGRIKLQLLGWGPQNLWASLEFEKEEDFVLYGRGFSRIKTVEFPTDIILTLKFRERTRSFSLKGKLKKPTCSGAKPRWEAPLSPDQARCLAEKAGFAYPIAESFLGRWIVAVERLTAIGPRYSPSHFNLQKPTLLLNARQHANEVSSTSYLLRFLMGSPPRGVNYAAIPVENPDGAQLALEMMERESPLHSLHAGRYNALGTDIGYHTEEFFPYAPEGYARATIQERWKADIFLNLHGYPSHEWVQQFTGYLPFPYRNYWIPRGHFFYFSSRENPLNREFSTRSMELLRFLAKTLSSDPEIRRFNRRLYGRYYRWAQRWNPHAFRVEVLENYNVYWKDGRKVELKSTVPISREVPEFMDETASGDFLRYLIRCGLKYLKAHADFLQRHGKKTMEIFHRTTFEITQKLIRPAW